MNHITSSPRSGLGAWNAVADNQRYSIMSQHMLLAQQVSKLEHLTSVTHIMADQDVQPRRSVTSGRGQEFRSAEPVLVSDISRPINATPRAVSPPPTANIGRPRTKGRGLDRSASTTSAGDWTWCPPPLQRPAIPTRTSSMSTRRRKKNGTCKPDLAAFHRRSCQIFASLDSRVSNPISDDSRRTHTSSSSSPSLSSSVTTQATSILDDNWYVDPNLASGHLELHDPGMLTQLHGPALNFGDLHPPHPVRLGERRSSSQLSPQIVSTEQVFWSSDASREVEYAKIDAAERGLKGFMKRMLPRTWARSYSKQRGFYGNRQSPSVSHYHVNKVRKITTYDDQKDNDLESVRRFRISIASATQEAIDGVKTHGVSRTNTPLPFDMDGMDSARASPDLSHRERKSSKASTGTFERVLAKVRSTDALGKIFNSSGKHSANRKGPRNSYRHSGEVSVY